MKKILFVLNDLEKGGGAQKVASILIKSFCDINYKVDAVLLYQHLVDYVIPITPIKLPIPKKSNNIFGKSINFISRILYLRNCIKEQKPDIIISFMTHQNYLSILSCLFFRKRPRIILTEHNPPSFILPRLPFPLNNLFLYQVLYSAADFIVPVSKGVGQQMIIKYKLPKKKIIPIYNPIEIIEIKKKAEEKLELIRLKDKKIVLAVGRLTYQKGFDILLNAFKQVLKQINCCLVIVGRGEDEKNLKELAKILKIDNHVFFAGFQKNPFKYMKLADVFVLSSRWEGLGCVLEEAMALGVPIVSTNCNYGPDELLDYGKSGILVPVNEETQLARSIIQLLNDEKLQEQYSCLGVERAEDFDKDKIVVEYETLFY